MKPAPDRRGGYLGVVLKSPHLRRSAKVHTLVLEAFVGERPEGMECCHMNGDHTDNRLNNLRWDTRTANIADRIAHGKSKKSHCPKGHRYTDENTKMVQHTHTRRWYKRCLQCCKEWREGVRQREQIERRTNPEWVARRRKRDRERARKAVSA